MFSDIDIRRIKDSASIREVMEDFITLKREGPNYTCLCPFHADRHLGSFKISTKHNSYHCFSCGASGGPVDFLMDYAGYTFPEAIRYLGAKYGITIEGSENYHPKPCKPHEPPKPLPMLVMNKDYVLARRDLTDDTLCKWIKSLPWNDEQRGRIDKVLKNYLVGHSKQGHTIFWQMDERGHLRTGKMMRYLPNGHRDRESDGNFSWIHTKLAQAGMFNPDEQDVHTTIFGLHLLDYYPDATVNIVESEKTALICAIYFGETCNDLWMASGGLSMLTRERLAPIIERGRKISLYPDHDAVNKWQVQAESLGYDKIKVQSMFVNRNWKPDDGEKADIADIIVRLLEETRTGKVQRVGDTIKQMILTNPFLENLIERFQLTPIIPA